ncbi:MAG: galactokinase [Cytophagales bacterium]
MTELLRLKLEVNDKFQQHYNKAPQFVSAAPGRINIIGEHTDYNFGLALPAAINRWVIISMAFREDSEIHIHSENYGSQMVFIPNNPFTETESWTKYIHGALDIFAKKDKLNRGFDALIWGNVPLGAGVSSSAAIEVAMMNLLRTSFQATFDDITLVKNCQKIEHEYLKVKSGLLDQYASQFSKEGKLMVLDFKSLTHEYVDADMGDWCWILANTKVKRELAGSKYSERVVETQMGLNQLSNTNTQIEGFRDVTVNDLGSITDLVNRKRLKHLVYENIRVYNTAQAFKLKDMEKIGELLLESHYSLKNDYEVSCKELDFLVETGKKVKGWAGGRMMGGGFGGCTINLVKKEAIDSFSETILKEYNLKFGIEAELYIFDTAAGAKCDVLQPYASRV